MDKIFKTFFKKQLTIKSKNIKIISGILLIMFFIIFGMDTSVSCGGNNNNSMDKLIVYPDYPEAIQRDYRYTVSVTQGNITKKLNVYNHAQTGITGSRDYAPDNYRRFCEFAFSGSPVRVDITVHEDVSSYKIIPASYNLISEMNGNTISVYLNEPKYFMVKVNNELNSLLAVFADEPEDEAQIPNQNASDVMYFDTGWHETANGFLEVGANIKTLYIAPGAVLNARVDIKGSGTLVCGRGIILDPFGDISRYDITVGGNEGSGTKLLTLSAANITVKDIKLLDTRCYNIMVNRQNATITNVKILSTMITTDGITFGSASSNTKVRNCFIHNGDNVFVISGFSSSSVCTGIEIDDCIVGTTCAAIFPQGTLGENIIRNLEVFRTSGGLIGNRYNSSSQSRSIAGLTIENLNALECEYFPWIFKGDKMGDAPKLFTLKNISVPKSSGIDDIFKTTTNEDIIIVSGGGYQLNFENLYVDGDPIDSASLLNITNNGLSNNVFNFTLNSNTSGNIITTSVSYNVNYIEPLKVIIGSSHQFLRTKPVMNNTTVYLPLEEVAEIFKYVVNTQEQTISLYKGNNVISATVGSNTASINGANTQLSEVLILENGIIMAPLSFFTQHMGIPAAIDSQNGYIRITNVNDGKDILNPNNGIINKWVERTAYNVDLLTVEEENEKAYYVCNITQQYAGMERDVTDEVGRYGKGTYRLKFKAKTAQGMGTKSLRSIFDIQYGMTKKSNAKALSITEEWKEYSVDFNITWIDDSIVSARISFTSPDMADFLVKDIALLKIN